MTKALMADEAGDLILETSLRGHVTATRAEIEAVFGAPTYTNEGDKVTTEWVILFENNVVATVYDWKVYVAPEMNEIFRWNIGGHNEKACLQVGVELGKRPQIW